MKLILDRFFLQQMLAFDPKIRPTADECLKHAFFQLESIWWVALLFYVNIIIIFIIPIFIVFHKFHRINSLLLVLPTCHRLILRLEHL